MSAKRVEDFGFPYEFLIRSGRAVMIPAFWGTLERARPTSALPTNEEIDRSIKWSRDLGRSIDYLQTRTDIDITKLGFYAISWGAAHAPRLLAVDTRFKAAALLSGGLFRTAARDRFVEFCAAVSRADADGERQAGFHLPVRNEPEDPVQCPGNAGRRQEAACLRGRPPQSGHAPGSARRDHCVVRPLSRARPDRNHR